jgi:HPt (histidine-containing phosphotransfer) domain-containing protein
MVSDAQNALAAALDRLWIQYQPQMQQRIDLLDLSAQAFAAGELSIDQQESASSAAHKLAGVLGTFGLTRGTILARELEILYSRQTGPDPEMDLQLASLAAELRAIVANRTQNL